MNDKELADAIVALGVGSRDIGVRNKELVYIDKFTIESDRYMAANEFIRDWRVAGATMENCRRKLSCEEWCKFCDSLKHAYHFSYKTDGAFPRAICESCMEAQKSEDTKP